MDFNASRVHISTALPKGIDCSGIQEVRAPYCKGVVEHYFHESTYCTSQAAITGEKIYEHALPRHLCP